MTASRMLPLEALNNGVRIILRQTDPTKKGITPQALRGVPLRKNAGRCQVQLSAFSKHQAFISKQKASIPR